MSTSTSSRRRQYSEEDFLTAYKAISMGMSLRKAAELYKVPKTTLAGRIKSGQIQRPRNGPPTVLNEEEELRLVEWILTCWRAGFTSCRESAVSAQARRLLTLSGRETDLRRRAEFSRHWFPNYCRRHPRVREVMEKSWGALQSDWRFDRAQLETWFERIGVYLSISGLDPVLHQPTRLLHCMQLQFAPHVSVMLSYSAAGLATPPLLVLPESAKATELTLPRGWSCCPHTEAQLDSKVLQHYIEQVLHPYLLHVEVEFPVILFLDQQKQAPNFELFEACRKLDIVLINLYNLAFDKLRRACRQPLQAWRGQSTDLLDFVEQLKQTLVFNLTKRNMSDAFSSAGLYPFDVAGADVCYLAESKDAGQVDQQPIEAVDCTETTLEDSKLELLENELEYALYASDIGDLQTLDLHDFKQLIGDSLYANLEKYEQCRTVRKKSAEFMALHKIYKRLTQTDVVETKDEELAKL